MNRRVEAVKAIDALLPKCRTFNDDGSGPICDQPGRYVVWGHLIGKMDKGPKCYRHLPKEIKEFRPGVGVGPVFDLREFALTVQEQGLRDVAAVLAERAPQMGMNAVGMQAAEGIVLGAADQLTKLIEEGP